MDAESNNLKLISDLKKCCYDKKMINYLSNMINKILNYPKKTGNVNYSIKIINKNKIIVISDPMLIQSKETNQIVQIKLILCQKFHKNHLNFL